MLMQSSDGFLHLLPALPDAWQQHGTISGLRARGGFEIVNMQWQDSKLVKVVIKSALGGNLRLRVPVEMKLSNGTALKKAIGENKNLFYEVEKIPEPIVSEKAKITLPELRQTFVYDIPTQAGITYILIAK